MQTYIHLACLETLESYGLSTWANKVPSFSSISEKLTSYGLKLELKRGTFSAPCRRSLTIFYYFYNDFFFFRYPDGLHHLAHKFHNNTNSSNSDLTKTDNWKVVTEEDEEEEEEDRHQTVEQESRHHLIDDHHDHQGQIAPERRTSSSAMSNNNNNSCNQLQIPVTGKNGKPGSPTSSEFL